MLSESFAAWVRTLDPRERVLVPAQPTRLRNETLKEFFANRSN